MSILGSRLIPTDVRQVIDRTDDRLLSMIERLAVIADQLSEQNSLLVEQNKLLRTRMNESKPRS